MRKITIARLLFLFFISDFVYTSSVRAASVVLHSRNAVAWLPQQTMQGSLVGFLAKSIIIHQDNKTFGVTVTDSVFQFSFVLHDGTNMIWAEAANNGKRIVSDTVHLQLGYHPEPVMKPYEVINNEEAILHVKSIMNPWKKLSFQWSADKGNPEVSTIRHANDSTAEVVIPQAKGLYYFNLVVTSEKDTAKYQTFVMRTNHSLQAFNMNLSYAPWIDSAIIYEISPHAFVANPSYDDITAKLPEIKSLGVNTIWLQPLFKNYDHTQGYEVTDYFSLRDDLGTEAQLQRLITTAKQLGFRILFDFVPNHTSVHHPYALDVVRFKKDSHYYNFYQHEDDGAMYSSHYHTDSSSFVYYFWDDLVNLNYSNKEVQQWIIEACKYWVKKYDIDGYRFDAVWGVNARQPDFGKRLQSELKSIKPDLFFLAEDKAFGGALKKGFDAVYDWTADTGWVSQWSWQYEYHPKQSHTLFNHPVVEKRSQLMKNILFDSTNSEGLRLRFLENNDLPRFIATHKLEQTKTAAILTFLLPGIPMLYNGQEAGIKTFPSKKHPTFLTHQTIQSLDSNALFPFYQQLIALRKAHPCLISGKMEEVKVFSPSSVFAFKRWNEKETIFTVVNMSNSVTLASLSLKKLPAKDHFFFTLTDLMTGEELHDASKDGMQINIALKASEARVLLWKQKE